jgi:hypothetical protein
MDELRVLVDWDNCTDRLAPHASEAEVVRHADQSLERLQRRIETVIKPVPGLRAVEVRLYGSWRNGRFDGPEDRVTGIVSRAAERARRMVQRVPVTFEVAQGSAIEGMLGLPTAVTPYRAQRECRKWGCYERLEEQKLVDTMIVADAIYYSAFADTGVAVMSDDMDMLPGLLTAADQRRLVKGEPTESIIWCRKKALRPEHRRLFSEHINVVEGVS